MHKKKYVMEDFILMSHLNFKHIINRYYCQSNVCCPLQRVASSLCIILLESLRRCVGSVVAWQAAGGRKSLGPADTTGVDDDGWTSQWSV